MIFSRIDNVEERQLYALQTIENGWSRNVLSAQISTNLYERSGRSIEMPPYWWTNISHFRETIFLFLKLQK